MVVRSWADKLAEAEGKELLIAKETQKLNWYVLAFAVFLDATSLLSSLIGMVMPTHLTFQRLIELDANDQQAYQ